MPERSRSTRRVLFGAILGLCMLNLGCLSHHGQIPIPSNLPRELSMTAHPPHLLEPGDTVAMTLRSLLLPKPPYRIRILDNLRITVSTGVPRLDITDETGNVFVVEPEGVVRLTAPYSPVKVLGLSLDEAGEQVRRSVLKDRPDFEKLSVLVTLEEGQSLDSLPDSALVRPDGTISLGSYGAVHVAGKSEEEARVMIEDHLSEFLIKPEVQLEVSSGDYKGFYLIVQTATGEETVSKVVLTGKETVLDILANNGGGFPVGGNRSRMWIARPAPADADCDQILPVRWTDIVMRGRTATNYQLLPGDRLYVASDPYLRANEIINRVTLPITTAASFASNTLSTVDIFRASLATPGGIFSNGFFGFGGFPGFGLGF